jgi:transcriptional regulator with XRE-family HTH domain
MDTEKDRIGKIMELEGLNTTQFASMIDVKVPTLSHILTGRNNPSLDVLKKILETFRTISSDWLIFGTGQMYRPTKDSQSPSLFDESELNARLQGSYVDKTSQKSYPQKESIQSHKSDSVDLSNKMNETPVQIATKEVKRIIIYYEDNTFREFIPK